MVTRESPRGPTGSPRDKRASGAVPRLLKQAGDVI